MKKQLHTTVILAMTADGKISDRHNSAARFGSANDKAHLEQQVALADGVLFGAGTLRAYGTTMSVSNPQLLEQRKERSQQPQPVQIVASASADLDPQWHFFQQPVPRWLITIAENEAKGRASSKFEQVIATRGKDTKIDWKTAFEQLSELGLNRLAILGGGELVASLLEEDLIDELWLTVCPLILVGNTAPTPVGGQGLIQAEGKKLQLLKVKQVEQELFLHYQIVRTTSIQNQ